MKYDAVFPKIEKLESMIPSLKAAIDSLNSQTKTINERKAEKEDSEKFYAIE